MILLNRIYNVLLTNHWSIGFAVADLQQMIRAKSNAISFQWMRGNEEKFSEAEPSLTATRNNNMIMFCRHQSNDKDYSTISSTRLDKKFLPISNKVILDNGKDISFPQVIEVESRRYLLPDACDQDGLYLYEYDDSGDELVNKTMLVREPLQRATMLKLNGKFWIFATKPGEAARHKLYIYHADQLQGPYKPHIKNPVKDSYYNTRSAGNFIFADNEVYRPTINCKTDKPSIIINRINALTEEDFAEEDYLVIKAPKKNGHAVNLTSFYNLDERIVVGGMIKRFNPLTKFLASFQKIFRS